MLKIWGRPNSINVQKVMWTVAELGLAHERIDAGMAHGKVGEAWFAKLNPNRTIPVIDHDGTVVWESNAIVRYLVAQSPDSGLWPADAASRAHVDMWMDWQQTTLSTGLSPLFLGLIRTPPDKRDSKALALAATATAAAMQVLDAELAGHDHVVGDSLTAADIALGCCAYRWLALPVERPATDNLVRWYERLTARPAFRTHVMLPVT